MKLSLWFILLLLTVGIIAQTISTTTLRVGTIQRSETFAFALTSDVHVGRPATFGAGEPSNNFVHIVAQSPAFIIATGDITDQSQVAQTTYMANVTNALASVPFWILAGNHDACPELPDDGSGSAGVDACSESYSNYIAILNAGSTNLHWVHDYGLSLRFIGFDSRQIRSGGLNGFAKIEDWEYSWLTNEIEVARSAGKKTVLCSHFPLLDDFGNNIKTHQTELLSAITNAANVVAYFGGHRHQWGDYVVTNGTTHVNTPGLSYSAGAADSPYSANGGYFWVGVTNRQMQLQLYTADDPTYTIRATNIVINY